MGQNDNIWNSMRYCLFRSSRTSVVPSKADKKVGQIYATGISGECNYITYSILGCKITLISPGAKFRQEEATDKACKSPTLFREVTTIRKPTLRVRSFTEADFRGLKGTLANPLSTTERSQDKMCCVHIGLCIKWDTNTCLPTVIPLIWFWQAEIAAI